MDSSPPPSRNMPQLTSCARAQEAVRWLEACSRFARHYGMSCNKGGGVAASGSSLPWQLALDKARAADCAHNDKAPITQSTDIFGPSVPLVGLQGTMLHCVRQCMSMCHQKHAALRKENRRYARNQKCSSVQHYKVSACPIAAYGPSSQAP